MAKCSIFDNLHERTMKATYLTAIAAILMGCAKEAAVEPKEPETLLPARVELVSPAAGDTIRIGQPVTFVWRTFPGADEYSIRIVRAGASLHYVTGNMLTDTSFMVTPTNNWPAAIWWHVGVLGMEDSRSAYRTVYVRP